MQDPRRVVGATIRIIRTNVGLTQERLAEECGLHRTYVGAVERGERNVGLLNIVAIARALKVPPSQLLQRVR